MIIIDLGGPAAEPLMLQEAKGWARIERDDEDALLLRLVKAARESVEAETGLVLARRSFRLSVDPVPQDGWIEVGRRPVKAVTAITAFDVAGAPVAFDAEHAVVEHALGLAAIRVSPAVRMAAVNGLEIEFEAGFDLEEVPETLRLALSRIVGVSYELRAAFGAEDQPAMIPDSARALIQPFRRVRL